MEILRTGLTKIKQRSETLPAPLVALTVFHFNNPDRWWALAQMGLARPLLFKVKGLRFHKMLGAGKGPGFTLLPDWNRYALLTTWENEARAGDFFQNSAFMRRFKSRADRISTVYLRPISAHGNWNGKNPFQVPTPENAENKGPVAVLTRASIRPRRLGEFWQKVPPVSLILEGSAGLVASLGVGEAPFFRQATFSIWENKEALQNFAYKSAEHREALSLTRSRKWYSEELFARFTILKIEGDFP